ncbi:MAG TPA: aminopeptidase P N-terminal domain-containing protein, partial [Blastocatellia bacterium]|nr:aminopeptidase P N-terminal domain-containing protein [Blastocatellia bacterium]
MTSAKTERVLLPDLSRRRREELMSRIRGGVAIFPSAPLAIRNGDVDHEYRQNSDLYYLTGFEEPGAVAVIAPDHPEHKFVLFVRPKDREQEVWTGWRAGEEGAKADYKADAAFTSDKLDEELPKLVQNAEAIYYRLGIDSGLDKRIIELMKRFQRERQRSGKGPNALVDPADVLHELRLVKSEEEIELLRRAVDITAEGHLASMRVLRPGMFEHEIEAVLRYEFLRH